MAEMERNYLACVPQGVCWVSGGASSSDAQPQVFQWRGSSEIFGLRNLEWLCEMKMEEIRGLNMDLNDGWNFRKFPRIRKLIRKLPHFAT